MSCEHFCFHFKKNKMIFKCIGQEKMKNIKMKSKLIFIRANGNTNLMPEIRACSVCKGWSEKSAYRDKNCEKSSLVTGFTANIMDERPYYICILTLLYLLEQQDLCRHTNELTSRWFVTNAGKQHIEVLFSWTRVVHWNLFFWRVSFLKI